MTDIIWQAELDNRYNCEVNRVGSSTGILSVRDNETGNTLLSEEVSLSYDALFGPDMLDINSWENRILKVIDQ